MGVKVVRAIDVDADSETFYVDGHVVEETHPIYGYLYPTDDIDIVLEKLVGSLIETYDVIDADTSETGGMFPWNLEDVVEVGPLDEATFEAKEDK